MDLAASSPAHHYYIIHIAGILTMGKIYGQNPEIGVVLRDVPGWFQGRFKPSSCGVSMAVQW